MCLIIGKVFLIVKYIFCAILAYFCRNVTKAKRMPKYLADFKNPHYNILYTK